MATKKATKPKASASKTGESRAVAAKAVKKTTPTKAKVSTKAKSKTKGLIAKVGEVADTMFAAAVEGAVKGAAHEIEADEAKRSLSKGRTSKAHAKTTAEVAGEIAPGAVSGAILAAAESVMPSPKGKEAVVALKGKAKPTKARRSAPKN